MADLFSEGKIGGKSVKNRAVLPSTVLFVREAPGGFVTDERVDCYELVAKSGVGLIIVEATCVKSDGLLWEYQMGIWDDKFIPGLKRLADACKKPGARVLIQIHHGGLRTVGGHAKQSIDQFSLEEIENIAQAFADAAVRAKKAGFDGVDVHGAHNYLLDTFVSPLKNNRNDEYGGSLENRLRLSLGIIGRIRRACGGDFIISYRLGANIPDISEGVKAVRLLEKAGVDVLNVSYSTIKAVDFPVPWDLPYNHVVYMASEIKKQAKVPVIAVNGIKTPEAASYLVENGLCDFVAVSKGQLADPMWFKKALTGQPINLCLGCSPRCRCFEAIYLCPQRQKSLAEIKCLK